mgnify:CR=1 FL=1|jgi:hypothetical protein
MTIKINDKQFKILGMLSEIADEEIANWGVENKPAIQHSILSRVTDVDDKIPGFNKGTTCIFNSATHIDDSIICCVAVKIDDEIVLYTLAKSSFIGFGSHDYDNYSWNMRVLGDGFDSKEITYAKAFANVADRAKELRREFFMVKDSKFLTREICQELWGICSCVAETTDTSWKQSKRFFNQAVSFVFGDGAVFVADEPKDEFPEVIGDGTIYVPIKDSNPVPYVVGSDYVQGMKDFWKMSAGVVDSVWESVRILDEIDNSGVMASSKRFDYSEVYSLIPGFSKELTDLEKMQEDPELTSMGEFDIIDGFAVKDNGFIGVVVLCRHYIEDTYSWNIFTDDRIAGYLKSVGWKSGN